MSTTPERRFHPVAGPLKWHGGKHYLAGRIVSLMPRHLHYVEPFAGGLAVLLARDPADPSLWLPPHKGVSEVANDLDGRLVNFWPGQPLFSRTTGPVVLENLAALQLVRREDGPGTLFYCDPPYLPRTRTARRAYGPFEMTEAEHAELLAVLRQAKGKVMLSGYPSALYDGALAGWNRHAFDVPNHASGARAKGRETEVLWCNF
jgi:site-specific DNA-adenine methylase